MPSAPLERAFAALADGVVDACALIHEGRLTYAERGLQLVCDLGVFWQRDAQPAASRSAATSSARASATTPSRRASTMLRASIAYALDHRDEALDELAGDRGLSRAQADEYLALYANDDTLDYGDDGRRAIAALVGDVPFAP